MRLSRILAAVVASLALGTGVALAQELRPQEDGEVVEVDVRTPVFEPSESNARVVWQHEFADWRGAHSLRLRFGGVSVPDDAGADSVELLIQDRTGTVIERHRGEAMERLSGRWSLTIPGDYALLSLVAPQPPVGFEVEVDAATRTTVPGVSLSLIGTSEMQPIADYGHDPFIVALARPVAKLTFVSGGLSYVCSGFMISPDLLMTNEHCVNNRMTCLTTIAIFGYQLNHVGVPISGTQYRCLELVAQDFELDVAVLRMERSPGLEWGVLEVAAESSDVEEPVMIIQHPGGDPKMISIIECAVTTPIAPGRGAETDMAHRCDTEGGSSGSPIMNASGKVIALHHFGVGQGTFWNQNRGVRMARIMERVLAGIGG